MLKDFLDEFRRHKATCEKAIAQVSDEGLNRVIGLGNNSIAVIVRHVSGNLVSRFTDFLTSDGEKPWRDRDAEFDVREYDRREVERMWADGWRVLKGELTNLTDSDLGREVVIRGQTLTVHEALARSLAHFSYHVGQIVLLARILSEGEWEWISIPKGKSAEYNRDPTMEKGPR
jgi:uncharacterized damage-inducible protein DinB